MATTIAQLQAVISADTKSAHQNIQGLHDEIGKSPGLFAKAGAGIAGFVAGGALLNIVTNAAGQVFGAISDMVRAAGESQQVMAQTEAGIKSTGGVAGMTAKSISDLATQISNLSGIDDEAVQTGENMLLTFTNIGKSVFPQATQAIADMATKMNGGAVPSAQQMQQQALLLGKALNDPLKGITALTREGVTFTDAQKNAIAAMMRTGDIAGAQKIILAEVGKEFGGAAEAAGNTFPGKLAKLNTAWGNIQETIGGAIIPILSDLMDSLSPVMKAIGDNLPGALATLGAIFAPIFDTIKDVVSQVGPQLKDMMSSFSGGGTTGGLSTLKNLFTTLAPIIKDVAQTFVTKVLPVLMTLGQIIATQVMPAVSNIVQALVTNLLPIILRLWGIIGPLLIPVLQLLGWIFANVVGPVLVFIINVLGFLINKFLDLIAPIGKAGDFIKLAIKGMQIHFNMIKDTVTHVVGWIGQQWELFKIGAKIAWDKLVEIITGIKGKIDAAVKSVVGNIVKPVIDLGTRLFNAGKDAIQRLIDGIKSMAGNVGKAFSDLFGRLHIPGFASGGVAPGGLAVVGEHGPEIVALPAGARVYPHGQSPFAAGASGASQAAGGGGGTTVINLVLDDVGQRTLARVLLPHQVEFIRAQTGTRR